MTDAKRCDRCGTFEEGPSQVADLKINAPLGLQISGSRDLCSDCIDSFKEWWEAIE